MFQPKEEAIKFLLSLAPHVEFELIKSDSLFAEDKEEQEIIKSQKAQLEKSIAISKQSGQFDLYLKIYKPAMAKFIDPPEVDENILRKQNQKIEEFLRYIHNSKQVQECFEGSDPRKYHPLNKSQTNILMIFLELNNDPYKNLFTSSEHDGLIQAICFVRDINENTPYIAPTGRFVKHMPIPIWEPNKPELQHQAFTDGYFVGPCGQRFYTPLCKTGIPEHATPGMIVELKDQLRKAFESKLIAYQIIADSDLSVIKVTRTHIVHMESNDDVPF